MPFGRYQFNILPFGITSAPELFQKCMYTLLSNQNSVLCLMDNVLVYCKHQSKYDIHLEAVSLSTVVLNSRDQQRNVCYGKKCT